MIEETENNATQFHPDPAIAQALVDHALEAGETYLPTLDEKVRELESRVASLEAEAAAAIESDLSKIKSGLAKLLHPSKW